MSQQLDHFGDVSGLSGFLEEIEKLLERSGIVAHMADDGVKIFEDFIGILSQEAVGMLIVNLQRVFVLTRLHQGVGKSRRSRRGRCGR